MTTASSTSSKRTEFFWPRQVLRKLLNLKPIQEHFDADVAEDDEDEDDEDGDEFYCGLSDSSDDKASSSSSSCRSKVWSSSLPPRHPNAPDRHSAHSPGESGMLGRRQSETLWRQLVDMQDYRIHVGTWNVAGKSPSSDLDLVEWLELNPATDVYILGLQEIVPLNAGNVLGTADETSAIKWDALIRRTLNGNPRRTLSAPPSPASLFPDDKADEGQEQQEQHTNEHQQQQQQQRAEEVSPSLHLSMSSAETGAKLHRSNRRIAPELAHRRTYSAIEEALSDWSVQSKVGTVAMPQSASDGTSSPGSGSYVRIVSKQMVGVYISVWIRKNLRRYVHHLKVCCVGCGLMGYCGNKGSVAVSMLLHQTSFCFVCTHLTSGERGGDELRRNSDVMEIIKRTSFIRSPRRVISVDLPETILQHDRVIWLGDLNYRLSMSDAETRALVAKEDWETLLEKDQLRLEQSAGRVFEGWEEGAIDFAPTYKYKKNSDRYFGDNPKPGDKRRTPSWCDRILFRGRGLRQLAYVRKECRFSDHRPVNAIFIAEVEAFSSRKIKTVARVAAGKPVGATRTSSASHSKEQLEQAVDLIRSLKQPDSQNPSLWHLAAQQTTTTPAAAYAGFSTDEKKHSETKES